MAAMSLGAISISSSQTVRTHLSLMLLLKNLLRLGVLVMSTTSVVLWSSVVTTEKMLMLVSVSLRLTKSLFGCSTTHESSRSWTGVDDSSVMMAFTSQFVNNAIFIHRILKCSTRPLKPSSQFRWLLQDVLNIVTYRLKYIQEQGEGLRHCGYAS